MERYYIWVAIAAMVAGAIWYFNATAHGKKLIKQFYEYVSTEEFKESVHQVMVYAEELIVGNKVGHERLLYVCGWIHSHLPAALQKVVTTEMLAELVNELFEVYAVSVDGSKIVK